MPNPPLALLLLVLACGHGNAAPATSTPSPVASQSFAVAAHGPRQDPEDAPSATPPSEAQRTASGLAYVVLTPGTGTAHPGLDDRIRAHYIGWTASDLAMFDNSYARGEPIEFQAAHVIKGWGEIIGAMVVGEKTRVWIPAALAYEGKPNLPAGVLIFDIELVGFEPVAATAR